MILFVLLGNQFQKKEVQSLEINEENFEVVNSYEKVRFYSRLGSNYRGDLLKKAEKYNLIQSFKDAEIPVMESNRTIRFHQAWNANEQFHLIYSVNVLPEDDHPKDIPYMTFGDILLHNKQGQEARLTVDSFETDPNNSPDTTSNTGFLYDGRFYRSVWIKGNMEESFHDEIMKWESPVEEGDAVQQQLTLVNEVTFSNLNLMNKDFESKSVDSIRLPMKLTSFNQPLETIELNGEIQLTEDTKLTFKRYQVELYGEKLYVDLGENKDQIRKLTYYLNGREVRSPIQSDYNGEQYIEGTSLPFDNGEMQIHFTDARIPNEEEITYTLNRNSVEHFKNQLDKQEMPMTELDHAFGNINNEDTFTAMKVEQREANPGGKERVVFTFKINDNGDQNMYWFQDYNDYLIHKENFPNDSYMEEHPFIEVKNHSGERIDVFGINVYPSTNGNMVHIEMDEETFLNQESLNFKFFHFFTPYDLDTELMEIPLGK